MGDAVLPGLPHPGRLQEVLLRLGALPVSPAATGQDTRLHSRRRGRLPVGGAPQGEAWSPLMWS